MSSTDENETLADIVAEYRNDADAMDRGELYQPTTEYLRRLLDRIEAIDSADAWRSLYSPGNAAAMREAMLRCEAISCLPEIREQQCVRDMRNIIAAALSAPPRQCDIGTAEEQTERFARYCGTEVCKRKRCKTRPKALVIDSCALCWAQTPYAEEGGAK